MNFNKGMSCSSYCFTVVSLTVLSQFLLVSPSTIPTTKFIDAICQHVKEKAFCVKTLNAYPPAVAATDKYLAASAALHVGMSFAKKCESFCEKVAAKETPRLRKQLKECKDEFFSIYASLRSASQELKDTPETAYYDASVCTDHTTLMMNLLDKNRDKTSKTVKMMIHQMERHNAIGVGATISVGG